MMSSPTSNLEQQIQEISARVEALESTEIPDGFAVLESKLDRLISHMEAEQRRQDEQDELKRDLIPIANQMIKLSISELSEIGSDFKLEDVLYLVKRLLRDTHLLVDMLQRLESTVDLLDETKGIGQQVFQQLILRLDELERKGYFVFANGGAKIVDRIVTEFTEEDVNALGENIVTILKTVRNLTQPEIMALTNNAASAIRETPVAKDTPSAMGLLRELSDPQVRRGLARLLSMVKVFAEDPIDPGKN